MAVADCRPTFDVTVNDKWSGFFTWQYMGSRAANRFQTFSLPFFSQFDLGATYVPSKNWTFGLNVNNVTNSKAVMSWAAPGSFLSALDRQGFTPAVRAANQNATFSVVTGQPRAGYLTFTYKID
jgi:iron complex outermembrane recepter protein